MVDINYPIPVAISALLDNNKILLIRRVKDGFEGFWSLPGGKVKREEHVSEAAVREFLEETGIETKFKQHLGFVSEHQIHPEGVKHVLLHVCLLESYNPAEIRQLDEGELAWFDLDQLHEIRHQMIPSDYLMIESMVRNKHGNYFDCVIRMGEKNDHALIKFE